MIIKNFRSLASSEIRRHALEIIDEGIRAVLVKPSMRRQINLSNNILGIQDYRWDLSKYRNIFVIGAGKAAADMAEAIEEILGKRITRGIVIDTRNKRLSRIKVVKGTHPLSSKKNMIATEEIIRILEKRGKDDLVINLISGGGSALMVSPRINLEKQIKVSKMLLKKGATIQEINTIRKHISKIKGGQLAMIGQRSAWITLIVSDVITNDISVIASGPTVKDSTTVKDAKAIQRKYSLPDMSFVETPKKNLPNVVNILLVTNISAAEAMKKKAVSLGYESRILTTQLKGEAGEIGKKVARMIKPKKAIIATGETTVVVKGNGRGGRNQEFVLSASRYIKEGVVASCSSDGVDFITSSAGGIADELTKEKAKKLGLNADKYLKNNDSYSFLKRTNGVIVTGKTGTNVGDLIVVLGKNGD